jgi:hypothetical protein
LQLVDGPHETESAPQETGGQPFQKLICSVAQSTHSTSPGRSKLIEPERTRTGGPCCGNGFYGVLPVDQVKEEMKKRAREMPAEDVALSCVSCIKAMHIGGKRP